MRPLEFRLGVHTSISGGLHLSVERAKRLGCTTMQVFSHNPRRWDMGNFSEEEIALFKKLRKLYDITPLYIHASYLINLCSSKENIFEKSITLLIRELETLILLDADYIVLHPGSSSKDSLTIVLSRFFKGLERTAVKDSFKGRILIENTAGSRGDIAVEIKDLAYILENDISGLVGGFCLDTCHAYAAGYDLTKGEDLTRLIREIKDYIGEDKIKLVHLNDSKKPFRSNIDRHEHIGKGYIGMEHLGIFLKHFISINMPIILETPKKSDIDDLRNLNVVKRLIEMDR